MSIYIGIWLQPFKVGKEGKDRVEVFFLFFVRSVEII
jgi:hypothetical protein